VELSIIKQGPVIARHDPEGDEGLPLGDDGRLWETIESKRVGALDMEDNVFIKL
jgi:hypothetical protein